MGSTSEVTTITIPKAVRRSLERYKGPGQTYGDILVEFMEEFPPKEFLTEMGRRFREEQRYSMEDILREAGL